MGLARLGLAAATGLRMVRPLALDLGPVRDRSPLAFSDAATRELAIAAPLAVDTLQALQRVDVVHSAGSVGGALAGLAAPVSMEAWAQTHHPDRLRLPPPPVRAPDGHALYASIGRMVQRFQRTQTEPVMARPDDVVREARLMGLLGGIHGLETEIRSEMHRTGR